MPIDPNGITWDGPPQPNGMVQIAPPDPLERGLKQGQLSAQGRDASQDALSAQKSQIDIAKGQRDLANPTGGASEGALKASAFVRRAIGGFRDYESLGMGPRSVVGQAVHNIAPGVLNALPDEIGNSPARVGADRAQKEFVSGVLRYDSGATIPPEEIASQSEIYFPKAGQVSPEELAGYRESRIRAIESLISSAGGAITPKLQSEIDAWRAEIAGKPAETHQGQHIYDPGGASASVSTGGTHTENDPNLSGANAKLNQLVKSGASATQIVGYLSSVGIPPREVMPSVMEAIKFRKKNPSYKGDYFVNVDDRLVPNSPLANAAASGLGAYGIAAADTLTGGHLDNAVGLSQGSDAAEMANIGIGDSRRNHPGASLAGDVTGGALLYGAGAGAGRALGLAPQAGKVGAFAPRALAADAGMGGYIGSGQGGTQIADPRNVALGAVTGAAAGGATRGALNTAGAALSPTGGALAPIYQAGGRPTIGQRMGAADNWAGRAANRAEQAFASVPLLGGIQRSARNASIDDMQLGAFNQALGEIGTALPKGVKKGTQAHAFMQRSFDKAYDKARSGMQFAPDGQWSADIGTLLGEAQMLSKDSQNTFRQFGAMLGTKLTASGGNLGGDQYKIIMSRIGKKVGALRSNPSGDTELADVLENFAQAIDDAARRQSNPNAVELLDAADRGYAKAVVIENAGRMRGGNAGEFNGTQLDASVQRTNKSRRSRAYLRGEATMQDYAAAAKKLGDEVPDSGTPERLLTLGGMGSLAHFVDPIALTPWAANTAANLPGVRQALGAAMAPRPQSIRPATDAVRKRLENMARYGGPLVVGPQVSE